MIRPLILWDVDDVMNSLMRLWFEEKIAEKGNLRYEDIHSNPPYEQIGMSRQEYLDSLDDFREKKLYSEPPREEILDFFEQCGDQFTHTVLSSVPGKFMGRSAEWVLDHFGKWIQNVCFVPSYREDFPVRSFLFQTKKEAVKFFGGVLVDDSPENIDSVIANGGKGFLFPAPWNSASDRSIPEALKKISETLLK